MSTKLISIIIPTFNRAHLISETLDSLSAQSYWNWECIIVDDGSTDNTYEVVKEYEEKDNRFQYYHRPKNRPKGPNSCRNYGFEISRGDFVNWFDSDDVMKPSFLQDKMKVMNNVDVVICNIIHYDFLNKLILRANNIISDNPIEDYLVGRITYYVSGPLWNRVFLEEQKQLFDESITNLDDWDFNLRMLYAKPKMELINEALIQYRIHNDSLSQKIIKKDFYEIKSEFKARKKHLLLLLFKKDVNTTEFRRFIIRRNKIYLREALIVKDKNKSFLFKTLLLAQIISFQVSGAIKTILGYYGYKYFDIGYRMFK